MSVFKSGLALGGRLGLVKVELLIGFDNFSLRVLLLLFGQLLGFSETIEPLGIPLVELLSVSVSLLLSRGIF